MPVNVLEICVAVVAGIVVVIASDEDCSPRDGFYAIHNSCNRPCVDDEECAETVGERCLCDGRCGLSCVNLDNTVGCYIPDQPMPPNTGMTLLTTITSTIPVSFGHHASIQCWQSYTLVGDSNITCMANGDWSAMYHYCIGNTNETRPSTMCSGNLLVDVYNATTDVDDDATFTAGSTVTYACQPGFVQLGVIDHVTCLHNGSWTPVEIECIRDTCGNPDIPEGGIVSTYDFLVGSTISFSCQIGHGLVGDNSRTCVYDSGMAKPVWTNAAPTCQPMSCTAVSVTSPLQKDNSNTLIGTVVTFECDDGYRLTGETSITCLTNLQWSSNVPTCERIVCSSPRATSNIVIRSATSLQQLQQSDQIDFGEDIKYECSDPTKTLVGDEYRTCLQDSSFSGKIPTCHESCPELPPLANSDTFRTYYPTLTPSTAHGTVVLFYCRERGYFLHGANRCECVDGTWKIDKRDVILDSNNPWCSAVDNSVSDYFSYSLRTPLQYAIGKDNEYQMKAKKGSTVVIDCKRHSTASYWSPVWVYMSENPNTKPAILSSLKSSRISILTLGSKGDAGWYRLRLSSVTESNNGKYSCVNVGSKETSSSVKLIIGNTECGDPGVPENGVREPAEMPSYAPYFFTFRCNEGYKLFGSTKSRCSKSFNYEWTAPLPICEKIKKTCFGKTFPGWSDDNGFSSISYTTNDQEDEATQSFYCHVGYSLEPASAALAHCRNGSRPQWDIEDTQISCVEKDRKVILDPAPTKNRMYIIYTETDFSIACNLTFEDSSYQVEWKINDGTGQFIDVSTNSSSRVYTVAADTWAHLIITDSTLDNSGEYACDYYSTTPLSVDNREIISLQVKTCCPTPDVFPYGIISAPVRQDELYLPGDVVSLSCEEGYVLNGVTESVCVADGTWENYGSPECIPEMASSIYWGNWQVTDQTSLKLTGGNDVILDCKTGSDIWNDNPIGQLVGWFRIASDGTRNDNHLEQMIMDDGNKLRMFLPQTSSEQAGKYACGTAVNYTTVNVVIMVPCIPLADPDHGSVNGWSWRAGTVVNYTCESRYQVSGGDAIRTCQASGEWSGTEPLCILAECQDLSPPENGEFAVTPTFNLNTEVGFICADDSEFDIGANRVLLCQSDGTWNGTVPACNNKCQNTGCGPGAKCVIDTNSNEAMCVCKSVEEDCNSDVQTHVCGSDAQTYDSQCAMEVYACQEFGGSFPTKVANGNCVKRGLCTSRPVPTKYAQQCDSDNSYYYNPLLMKCTDTMMDSCMKEGTGFPTRESCDSSCTEVNYCNFARDPGPCNQQETRWYWDSSSSNSASHTCAQFTYGGCGGNENNFRTRDECLTTCPDRCEYCPDSMNLYNACDFGHYATRAKVLRLSRFEKTPQMTYPTTFHVNIKKVLKTNIALTTPGPQDEYDLWSTVLYRGVACPCPRFLALDSDYLIVSKLEDGPSTEYAQEPIITEGTYVRQWSEDLECELRCTSTCSEIFATLQLSPCPHPGNPKCNCCS